MAIFSTSIAAGSDDAQETNGTMALTGASLNANFATQTSGLLFGNVTLPPGSSISAASIELTIVNTTYDDPDVTIRAQAAANPTTFTAANNDITNRPRTSAAVVWDADNIGAGARATPDLSALVSEVIGLAGWASGNAMVFFVEGTADSQLRWAAYEDTSDPPAVLSITYTAPGASGQPVRSLHQFRIRN